MIKCTLEHKGKLVEVSYSSARTSLREKGH